VSEKGKRVKPRKLLDEAGPTDRLSRMSGGARNGQKAAVAAVASEAASAPAPQLDPTFAVMSVILLRRLCTVQRMSRYIGLKSVIWLAVCHSSYFFFFEK